jgi:hypothetical protein
MPRGVFPWLVITAFLACAVVSAQQPTTQRFELTLRTSIQALPFKLPNLPNLPNMPGFNAPQRIVGGEAVYPEPPVEPLFVTVPGDLKLKQNRLVLRVPRLSEQSPDKQGGRGEPVTTGGKAKMTHMQYWHPGTAEGPVTESVEVDASKMPMGPGEGMPELGPNPLEQLSRTAVGSEGELPERAVGGGDYVLNTGGTAVLDGFLAAIQVTQPEALSDVALPEGIDVTWEPVEGARGYILHAVAMLGDMQDVTVIQWVSTQNEPPERVQADYTVETSIQDDLDNGVLLPGDATSCRVPAGIFPAEPSMFTLTVTAVGNDFYANTDGLVVYGKIRSEWVGMKMPGAAGMGMMLPGAAEDEE